MKKKVGIVSLGCPKNRVDTEIMLGILENEDFEITGSGEEADIIVVNTCAFIESARQESLEAIAQMAENKKKRCEMLIVAGCLAERLKGAILDRIPEVDAVLGTGSYQRIGELVKRFYGSGKRALCIDGLDGVDYLENRRVISTPKSYAYLKIAEGCDNRCSYCAIPSLRGSFRSRRMEAVLNEARHLAESGIKEVILVAQDTTRYGTDIYGERKLPELLKEIGKYDGIEWIRVLYCYPDELDLSLIEEMAGNQKVVKYLDLPIQHVSDRILKLMGRRGTSREIKNLIEKARENIPGLVVRTSLIVGFPAESQEDFKEMYRFVKTMELDRLGVFAYSRERGTAAFGMRPQVPERVKLKRRDAIMELQREISRKNNQKRIGRVYKTLVEGKTDNGAYYYGRTYAEAPEIDGKVFFTGQGPLQGVELVNVRIVEAHDYDLIGVVTNEPSH